MEIITRVRDFSEKIKSYRIPQNSYVRVIIDRAEIGDPEKKFFLPIITHEEQKRILNLLPKQYEPGASEKLEKIIRESHLNTDCPEL
uniref:hypothetical protein n=1 Tax=Candidatus Electronema sp. TaxID=2698783 RepID=UPI004056AEBD